MPPSRGGRSPARAVTAHGRCGIRAVTAHVRCGIGSWGALGGRCLRMADYVRRLAATRAPPPQRANVGYALSPTRRPTRVTEREEPLTEEVASFPEVMRFPDEGMLSAPPTG